MNAPKLMSFIVAVILTMTFVSTNVFADQGRGGGDLVCDAKVRAISANIHEWVQNKGPEVGQLDLSSSLNPKTGVPYTLSEYSQAMLDLFKLPFESSCVTEGDPGYPVKVGDSSKVCVTHVKFGRIYSKCDQKKLLGMNSDLQIQQIHHEFAINVPGLEPDFGPISTYKVSSQLSAYIQDVVERRLVVVEKEPKLKYPGYHLADYSASDLLLARLPVAHDIIIHRNTTEEILTPPRLQKFLECSWHISKDKASGLNDLIIPRGTEFYISEINWSEDRNAVEYKFQGTDDWVSCYFSSESGPRSAGLIETGISAYFNDIYLWPGLKTNVPRP